MIKLTLLQRSIRDRSVQVDITITTEDRRVGGAMVMDKFRDIPECSISCRHLKKTKTNYIRTHKSPWIICLIDLEIKRDKINAIHDLFKFLSIMTNL